MPSKPTTTSLLLSLFLPLTSTATALAASSQGQADMPGKVDPNEHCPPSARKQCCTSLKQPTEDLTDGLGELLPLASGIDVSSLVGIGCTPIINGVCGNDVMCCSEGSKSGLGLSDGAVKFCHPPSKEKPS